MSVMDVREAITKAKEYLILVYADENISNVGLEEVEFDERSQKWNVTLGFYRRLGQPQNALAATLQGLSTPRRLYKVLRVDDWNGKVESIKARFMKEDAA